MARSHSTIQRAFLAASSSHLDLLTSLMQFTSDTLTHVYALVDASDQEEPRYIGITRNLARRLAQHIRTARTSPDCRARWIRQVLRAGGQIQIRSLALAANQVSVRLETEYIEAYRRSGYRLTNSTIGGQGGQLRTAEARQRHSVRMKAVFADETIRRHVSDGLKKTYANPEMKRRVSDKMKEAWADPERRKRYIAGFDRRHRDTWLQNLKAALNSPMVQSRRSASMRAAWQNHEIRQRRLASMFTARNRPDVRQKISDAHKRRFADPEERRKQSERMKLAWARKRESAKERQRWQEKPAV